MTVYHAEPDIVETGKGTNIFNGVDGRYKTTLNEKFVDDTKQFNLQSIGVFAGVSFRIPISTTKKVVEKKEEKCDDCDKFGLTVIAKDKFTGEVLANTDVVLKNSKNEIVGNGTTDSFGAVTFKDVAKDNYAIEGVLNDVALESTSVSSDEFKSNKNIQKEIVYADRNFIIKGKAFQCNTNTPISDVSVILENKNIAFKKITNTNEKGEFVLQLPEKGTFALFGKKKNFFSQVEEVNANNYSRDKNLFVKLEICSDKVDCGKAIVLEDINFDLDKDFIRNDAKPELNKLVQFLMDNPELSIELSSHTDSQGSDTYNEALSQRKANNSKTYLVNNGIASYRIIAKGYGEYKLKNTKCANGVSCTDAEHEINRRTEFKVICPD